MRDVPGPKPVRYMPSALWRLNWRKLEVPAPYTEYYAVLKDGEHLAEVFLGKSGFWYAVVFGRKNIRGTSKRTVCYHVVGMLTEQA